MKAVNGVSYSIEPGKTLGVVGESGSGKSVSAMSILRLLDGNGYIDSGEIFLDGKDLTKVPMNEMYHIRGNQISVIFQEPMTALNPVFSVERQLSEICIRDRPTHNAMVIPTLTPLASLPLTACHHHPKYAKCRFSFL